jgi:hypothetical protein
MKKFKIKFILLLTFSLIYLSCNNEETNLENVLLDAKMKTTLLSKIDDDQIIISTKLYSDPEKYGFKKSIYKNSTSSKTEIKLSRHDYYVRQLPGQKEEFVLLLKNTNNTNKLSANNKTYQYGMGSDYCICSGVASQQQPYPIFDDACEIISDRGSINLEFVGDLHGEGHNQLYPWGSDYFWACEWGVFNFQDTNNILVGSQTAEEEFRRYLRDQPEGWIQKL